MSNSNQTNNPNHALTGLVEEHQSLVQRVDGIRPDDVWIDVRNILHAPHDSSASGGREATPECLERRGRGPVTVEQIAQRLKWKPEEVVFLATRNWIPGAYQEDSQWYFDPRHLRIWYDDLLSGALRIPH